MVAFRSAKERIFSLPRSRVGAALLPLRGEQAQSEKFFKARSYGRSIVVAFRSAKGRIGTA
jgi:hypothetical protein